MATEKSSVQCPMYSSDPFGESPPEDRRTVRKLTIAIVLCSIFMVVEIIGGILSRSLAIITDAAHLLSDIAGFLISLFAVSWSRKRASTKMSFGYHRAEILGALGSIALVWVMTAYLVIEAVNRLFEPQPIDGRLMFRVACLGVLVNIVMGIVLYDQHHLHDNSHRRAQTQHSRLTEADPETGHPTHVHDRSSRNINLRAAFIHVAGDLIQSVGVMIASILIWYRPEWRVADPICTFVFSILVVASTWMLAKEAIVILMEGAPQSVDAQSLQRELLGVPGVSAVHDLHIWSLGPDKVSATIHVVIDDLTEQGVSHGQILSQCQQIACQHHIHHATIQLDPSQNLLHCRPSCCGYETDLVIPANRPA